MCLAEKSTSKRRIVMFQIIILIIFGLALTITTRPVLAQDEGGQIYIVQHDDTLWKIAEKYLGDGNYFEHIVAATHAKHTEDPSFAIINDPGLIFSESKLWIPALDSLPPLAKPIVTEPAENTTTSTTDDVPKTLPAANTSLNTSPGGQIAFSFWNNAPDRCTYEINIISVDACLTGAEACQANRRIFTLNNASEPALSPDGERLAFRGWGEIPEKYKDGQVDHPYFGCAAPRAERRLGHTTLDGVGYSGMVQYWEDSHPDWSPDGNRLLFDTGRNGDDLTRILVIGANGENEEDLRIVGQQPSWAPDNDRFVYRGCDLTGNRCGLWLARALPAQHWNTGHNMIGPVLEEPEAAHPDWSPVSEEIVYQSLVGSNWDIYIIKADGSNKRQLTTSPDLEGLPAWSPDGQWVAYLSNAGGNWGIWIIRADGSQRQQIFAFDGGIFTPLAIFPYGGRDWIDEQISWSK